MSSRIDIGSKVGFGVYEADLQTGELWKAGRRIKLQSQPFKVLTLLLERPGEVVSREELQLRLWGPDTVVDFDHSLGTAINKIRDALGDTADNPRFVETLAKRGYRFIAPVVVREAAPAVEDSDELAHTSTPDVTVLIAAPSHDVGTASIRSATLTSMAIPSRSKAGSWIAVICAAGALAGAGGFYAGSRRPSPLPRIDRLTAPAG